MILNLDVLFLIATLIVQTDHSDPLMDLSRFMRTCRAVYIACMPVFLQQHVIISMAVRRVFSLRAFLFNKEHGRDRARAIRRVELCGVQFDELMEERPDEMGYVVSAIVDILRRCKRIEFLCINHCEGLLTAYDGPEKAIQSLRHIKELKAFDVADYTASLIIRMESPVESALLKFQPDETRGVLPSFLATLRDGFYLLKQFADHLERIEIHDASYAFSWSFLQFPKVRHLVVDSEVADFNLKLLTDYFPNLRELHWGPEECEDEYIAEKRALALSDANHSFAANKWMTLDRLHCPLRRTYGLALACKAHIWETVIFTFEPDVWWFHTILGEIRPSVVDVEFGGPLITMRDFANGFPRSGIQHLRMSLSLEPEFDMREVLVRCIAQCGLSCTNDGDRSLKLGRGHQ